MSLIPCLVRLGNRAFGRGTEGIARGGQDVCVVDRKTGAIHQI